MRYTEGIPSVTEVTPPGLVPEPDGGLYAWAGALARVTSLDRDVAFAAGSTTGPLPGYRIPLSGLTLAPLVTGRSGRDDLRSAWHESWYAAAACLTTASLGFPPLDFKAPEEKTSGAYFFSARS